MMINHGPYDLLQIQPDYSLEYAMMTIKRIMRPELILKLMVGDDNWKYVGFSINGWFRMEPVFFFNGLFWGYDSFLAGLLRKEALFVFLTVECHYSLLFYTKPPL